MSVPADGMSRADAGRLPAAARARRRRRPSGEPPPLPRQLNKSGKFWLVVASVAVLFCALLVPSGGLTLRLDEIEGPVLSGLAAVRVDALSTFFRGLDAAIRPVVLAVWWGSILVMLIWRRWRHLFVLDRRRHRGGQHRREHGEPRCSGRGRYEVEILGSWAGFSMPSPADRPCSRAFLRQHRCTRWSRPAGAGRRGKWVVGGLLVRHRAVPALPGAGPPDRHLAGVILGVAVPLAALPAADAQRRLPGALHAAGGRPTST